MLEIIVTTLILVAAFIAVAWYANYRTKKMAKLLDLDDESDQEEYNGDSFDSLYEQELEQQTKELAKGTVDSEPTVTLSSPVAAPAPAAEKTAPSFSAVEQDDVELPTTAEQTPEPELAMNNDLAQEHDWDMVISFSIMAVEGQQFAGQLVRSTLDNADLHFGDMQIYHRYTPGVQQQTLFSVANILDPGTLIPDSLVGTSTPGLLMFARLPGPINGLTLFDDLLETANKLALTLGGVLCNDQRQPISDQEVEAMRSRIFDMNMTLQIESNQQ